MVATPADPQAQVTSVKSLDDVLPLLRGLRAATEPDVLASLRSIDAELKRLLRGSESEDDKAAQQKAEELAAVKALAASLKSFIAV